MDQFESNPCNIYIYFYYESTNINSCKIFFAIHRDRQTAKLTSTKRRMVSFVWGWLPSRLHCASGSLQWNKREVNNDNKTISVQNVFSMHTTPLKINNKQSLISLSLENIIILSLSRSNFLPLNRTNRHDSSIFKAHSNLSIEIYVISYCML